MLLRRIDQKPPWDAQLLDACAESSKRAQTTHHPSLLAVIDTVPSPGGLLIVTEYVQGVPLRVLMTRAREQRKPMPLRAALRIADELARALGAAEELLKSQGDSRPLVSLHPECVIISSGDDALIADLGMITLERVPEHPEIVAYRAPELDSGKGDSRSAVYTLGLILWETLAGRDAFGQSAPSATAAQVKKQAREGRVPRLDRIVRNVPSLLVELTMQSISVDPRARFPSVTAFGEALASVSEKRKPGELLKYMNDLCSDLTDKQRTGLTLTNIAAASWRPTVHTFDAPAMPVIPKAPRLIGLAAFQQTPNDPGVDSGNAVDSLLGHEDPVPSAPTITVEPMQVEMPASAPFSAGPRAPQATTPLLLVNKPTQTPVGLGPQRTSSTVGAAISYPDEEYPHPKRRWGLVFFVLLVLGGAVALGAFAVKKQLEPEAPGESPPIAPTLGMSGRPTSSAGSLPWPGDSTEVGGKPAPNASRRPGYVPRRAKDGGVAAPEPSASTTPPATSGEPQVPSDNPYKDPDPPPGASVDPKRGF